MGAPVMSIEEFMRSKQQGSQQNSQQANLPRFQPGQLQRTSVMQRTPVGSTSYDDIGTELEKQKALEGIKGTSGEVGGRVALARESLNEIKNIKDALFPTGKPESFDRSLAAGANIRAAVPIPFANKVLPAATPNVPFTKADDPFVNKSQDLARRLGTVLSGRQLIQTGVAARPEETERLIEQFAPNVWSGNRSALNALNQLEKFYYDYLQTIDPSGAKGTLRGVVNPTSDLSNLSDEELLRIAQGG